MQRLAFVQWLRVFLISLVVAHHAAQPYGPTGGRWPIDDPANAEWLAAFFSVNAAFFMGFFFLIAGYFTASSYDRKGGAAFVRDRLIRLGVPLLVLTFLVFPPVNYFMSGSGTGFATFYLRDYIGGWNLEMGPLWFVAQLLAVSLLYAAFRTWLARRGQTDDRALPVPGDRTILVYTLALALTGALVRVVAPQDLWIHVLWLIPAEPAHLPQYMSLFVVGIVAGRGRWFTTLPAAVGKRWFAIGFGAFAIMVALALNEDRFPDWYNGGVVWGFFEAFVCVGMILGLLMLFRAYCDRPGRWLERLEGNVYGVYILHIFIVVGLQTAILAYAWPATGKFLFVSALAIVLSFAASAVLRMIPIVRRVV